MNSYKITEPADRDLTEIWLYIAEHDLDAAEKLIQKFTGCFSLLAKNKKIGRDRSKLRDNLHSYVYKNYVIFYIERDSGVDIYRVLHTSRDIGSVIESLFNKT